MTFYTFANATTAIPLSNLDSNFATPITLGNTAVTINGTFSSIGNLTLNNANITSVATTFPNSFLANSTTTIGNTTVTLGSTSSSIGNLTLNNVTVASGNSTVTKETVTTITSPAATNLTIQSAGTTAMTIDTSQNVGIGTSSPVTNLTISSVSAAVGGDNTQYVQTIYTGSTTGATSPNSGYTAKNYYGTSQFFQWNNNGTRIGNRIITNSGSGILAFTYGNDTEGMRIDSSGNVGIGTTSVGAGTIVDVQSTTKGVRFPNMTTAQKTAITPAAGTVVFDTTLAKLCVYSGSAWQTITSV